MRTSVKGFLPGQNSEYLQTKRRLSRHSLKIHDLWGSTFLALFLASGKMALVSAVYVDSEACCCGDTGR